MPMIAASLGLFLSVIMPMGMPEAYMPRFAAVPCHNEYAFVVLGVRGDIQRHCSGSQIIGVCLQIVVPTQNTHTEDGQYVLLE